MLELHSQALATNGSGTGAAYADGTGEETCADETEALLLSRGLELASPPAIHSVLDGHPLLRSMLIEDTKDP
ncbi:jg23236 [Pararge aegeria aegeria]|uniref:Jg23236 protein n=1 Tax=Pararge aegeria aegeria TaxID=348720 RepID=A0A8S4RRM0_9NEOP|nr:jg23236 [Pararge aegeria aegeria]